MAANSQFSVVDFVMFAVTVLVSLAIGIYFALKSGGQRTTSDYLLGGRLVSFIPVAISLLVSFESSIMMLGNPAEGYVHGIQIVMGSIFGLFAHMLAAVVIPPLLHPLNITSAFEYLELRFNSRSVRLLGTIANLFTTMFYMGIVLFGPSVALEAVTGYPQWASIVVISVAAVIYTSAGGLKAVIWTDVFQAAVMYAGIFGILIKGTIEVGGVKDVWDIARKGGRLDFFNFNVDPHSRHTFFNLFPFYFVRSFGLAFNQSCVQRINSTKSPGEAKKVLMLASPGFTLISIMAVYEGTVAYSYYQVKGCDPFESKQLTNPNQIIPFFVMDLFKNVYGMPGLFLASLFSASMSTLSSGLSSSSASFWADIVKPLAGGVSDLKGTIIAKFSVLVFGTIACGIAFLISLIGGTLSQIANSLLGAFIGPLVGLFLSGIFCPRINSKGAFWGCMLSLMFSTWVCVGMNFSPVVKSTPYLPPASTDKCYLYATNFNTSSNYNSNSTEHHNYYTSTSSVFNNSDVTNNYHGLGLKNNIIDDVAVTMTTSKSEVNSLQANQDENKSLGVEELYTLSYTFVLPFGTFSTILFGFIISLITGCNKPGDVDPRYLLSISETVLFMLPGPVKRWLSSIGPQFIKEEYKNKFQDPALRHKVPNKEHTILVPGEKAEPLLLKLEPKTDKGLDTNSTKNTTKQTFLVSVTAEIDTDTNNPINSNGNGNRLAV